jgi:hypothetical protein
MYFNNKWTKRKLNAFLSAAKNQRLGIWSGGGDIGSGKTPLFPFYD